MHWIVCQAAYKCKSSKSSGGMESLDITVESPNTVNDEKLMGLKYGKFYMLHVQYIFTKHYIHQLLNIHNFTHNSG